MTLQCAAADGIADESVPTTAIRTRRPRAYGGLAELVNAGLLRVGEDLVWERRYRGERHVAQVLDGGVLRLADGRVCANPTGATNALGGYHQNGWAMWKRMADGRTLAHLRAELSGRAMAGGGF